MTPGKRIGEYPVLAVHHLGAEIYLMRLEAPELAASCRPGQFVNVRVSELPVPLLRKPFSICRRDASEGWVELLWQVVGTGTRILAGYQPGQRLNVLGALGRGFQVEVEADVACLVAGGLGVAPLPFLCEELLRAGKQVEVYLGARSKDGLVLLDAFAQMGVEARVSTEDGSCGRKGLVTELLVDALGKNETAKRRHLFSCGPTGFLRKMLDMTEQYDIEGQVSIETMMGCGFGICVGCPVPARESTPDAPKYFLTCLDGPVFDARAIRL